MASATKGGTNFLNGLVISVKYHRDASAERKHASLLNLTDRVRDFCQCSSGAIGGEA